jgi:hypothetical protein
LTRFAVQAADVLAINVAESMIGTHSAIWLNATNPRMT